MLAQLLVRDFAIIDRLELDLTRGFAVMTGETGAGKSIVVDALSLLLGEKGGAEVIRHHTPQAELSAVFALPPEHPALGWLAEEGLDAGGECILRRVLPRTGRGRAWINGRPVTLAQLDAVGGLLADIYGQHAHQGLLRADAQRALLDRFAGLDDLRHTVGQRYRAWQEAAKRVTAMEAASGERDSRLEFLRFQLQELDGTDPQADEWDALQKERRVLAAASQLRDGAGATLALLYEGDGAVADGLGAALRSLEGGARQDERLAPLLEMIQGALAQVEEAAAGLRSYQERLELDPQRLEMVEDRIDALQGLMRKHHCDYAGLLARRDQLAKEVRGLADIGASLGDARAAAAQMEADYLTAAQELSAGRRAGAIRLGEAVSHHIRALGMPQGRLEARITSVAGAEGWREHGLDTVEFWVALNPGHPPQPLARVASGGELSRIGLALQVVAASPGSADTLVFDEVDAGIGGAVAEVVGRLLRRLGEDRQVLCVTHLREVAAQAHRHFTVGKRLREGVTLSEVRCVAGTDREEELARMLGGVEIGPQLKATAREMLERAGV